MTHSMNIGEAAQAAGVSAKMIRHYEQIGLLPAARRTDSGYRRYGESDVSVLRFIRQSRQLDFSMQQISELLGLWSNSQRSSRQVKDLALQHIADLEQKMREMGAMKQALERLALLCQGDDHPHCTIIDGLAVDSPSRPDPEAIEAKPLRKGQATKRSSGLWPSNESVNLDHLSAWAHTAQAGRVGH